MKLSVPTIGQGGVSPVAPARRSSAPARAERTPADGEDRLELSRQAMRWVETLDDKRLRERERAQALRERLANGTDIREQLDAADATAEAALEPYEVLSRCMKIAANIMSGKKVPAKDVQYLMENDPKLYQMSVALRRPPKDDRECERVVRDGDGEAASGASPASGAGVSAGAVSAPAAPSGGEAPAAPADGGGEPA